MAILSAFLFGPCECCEQDEMRWTQVWENGWMAFDPPYDKFEKPIVEGGLVLLNYREQDRDVWVNPYLNFTGGLELNPDDEFRTWAIQVPTLLEAGTGYGFDFISTIDGDILTVEEVRDQNPGATYDPPVVRVYFFDESGGFGLFQGVVNQAGTFHVSVPANSVSSPRGSGFLFFGVHSGQRYLPERTVWQIVIRAT
jgi:hypothetical protein